MRTRFVFLTVTLVASCQRDAPSTPTTTATTQPMPPPAPPPPSEPGRGETMTGSSPDVALSRATMVNVNELQFGPGPDALPRGVTMAVLEGTPPFPENQSFMVALKMPANYTIPPHTHLVTERVTILQGTMSFGHGRTLDRTGAKSFAAGSVAVIPANHEHFAFTGNDETIITLQGVGPWGIFYVDPKDDPRDRPPAKPAGYVSRFDAPTPVIGLSPTDVTFGPAPQGMLPPRAQVATIEGDPARNKSFTIRIKVPDGYRFPVHTHSVTDRLTVISGVFLVGMGDQFREDQMKELSTGGIAIIPKDMRHYGMARGETTFQIQGVGPFDIRWMNPQEDPAQAAPQTSAR